MQKRGQFGAHEGARGRRRAQEGVTGQMRPLSPTEVPHFWGKPSDLFTKTAQKLHKK